MRDRADSGNGRGPCEGSPVRVGVPACGVRERLVARVRLSPMPREGQIEAERGESLVGRTAWKTARSVCTRFSNQVRA